VNRLIEERAGRIPIEDAKSRVLAEAQGYFTGPGFKLAAWPASARQVPEAADLQLVLCEEEKTARSVCANADDGDPQAPIPRRFQNAIVAITATASGLGAAIERARWLLAAEAIEKEHRTGDAGKMVREQLQRLKPELHKQFRMQTYRAFDRIVLAGGTSYAIEEQYQVPEEQMLQKPQGQTCLRKFLDAKGLLYQPGDALDVGRFVKDVLPGATPLPDVPEAYSVKAIHERFLAAPGLRLLPDAGIVRETLKKAISAGKMVIRLGDGRAYDQKGCVEGNEGQRRRVSGGLATIPLDDRTYVALTNSSPGTAWVREESPDIGKGRGPSVPIPPPQSTQAMATTVEKAIELAGDRALMELKLIAGTPAVASALSALAQPCGADSLRFSVTASGTLRDGGTMSFQATDVKPTHPTRPLQTAQTVFNALAEGGTYEAELTLQFGLVGRTGMQPTLRDMAQSAPEGLQLNATFGRPVGKNQ